MTLLADVVIDRRLLKARMALMMSEPFFGSLIMYLRFVPAPGIKTMATDGVYIFYDPKFLDEVPHKQLIGVLVHEVLHCALLHHIRRGNRDLTIWNYATDYCINIIAKDATYELPAWVLYDRKYDGMSAEQVYRELVRNPQQQPKPRNGGQKGQQQPGMGKPGQGDQPMFGPNNPLIGDNGEIIHVPTSVSDPAGTGGVIDAAPAMSPGDVAKQEAHWRVITQQAFNNSRAQNRGKVPSYLERIVTEIRAPKVNWRDPLRRFIDDRNTVDYSWSKPNRRFIHQGLYLPGYTADGISHLGLGIDTSGSIGAEVLALFKAESQSALDEGAVEKVTVFYADAKVHRVDTFQKGDILDFKPIGGGGTKFEPTWDYIRANGIDDLRGFIYFTDLFGSFGEAPEFPVLWATYGDPRSMQNKINTVPYGETIVIDE